MTKFFTFVLAFFISALSVVKSQALYPVSINEKVSASTLIIEGKVIDQYSFWNEKHNFIFTSNVIEVYKIFKGINTTQKIEIVTQGGTIGNKSLIASDLLELRKGETGLFFCYPNEMNARSQADNSLLYDVYGSEQGFIQYDEVKNTASAPFARYQNITGDLYNEIKNLTGLPVKILNNSFTIPVRQPNSSQRTNAFITSFSPAVVNAGATLSPSTNILTINGSGFGVPGGSNASIRFDDCNNGTGGTPYIVLSTDNSVISWTDNQIQVRVPTRAGTGFFSVRDASLSESTSPTALEVNYSVTSATFDNVTKQTNLMNDNSFGGYSILFSINTSGNGKDLSLGLLPERATIDRALTTWKEVAGFNFKDSGTTFVQAIQSDDINLIMFDNQNSGVTLSAGVLAVCYSWYNTCSPVSTVQYQLQEFDVIIKNNDRNATTADNTNFTAGPCAPAFNELDLETVVLHELGHAIGLGHINDGGAGFAPDFDGPKLMNYAVSFQAKRTSPDGSAYNGALYCITPKGLNYGSCGLANGEMIQLPYIAVTNDNCPVSFPSTGTPAGTIIPFDLVHATSNKLFDPAYTQVKNTSIGVSVTNTQFYALRSTTAGVINLTVSGYTTVPVDLSACTNPDENGIELSIYNVSSCPVGQSFPVPLTYRTFRSNGALTAISGITANTNYLIMVDGIYNTKATFNLTLAGTALPIKLTSFTGEVLKDANLLKWKAETIVGVAKIDIEKSSNNTNFTSIAQLTGVAVNNLNGSYKDNSPFTGNNYYRLKITDVDGSIEYTNIVLLKRSDKFLITLSPNPVKNILNVQVSANETAAYTFKLVNATGQTVLNKQLNVTSGNQSYPISVNTFAKGAYHAVIYSKTGEIIKNQVIVVE